jgi:hypothetical protein
MGKKHKQQRPRLLELAELKLTEREALIVDALIFNAQRDHAYTQVSFRNIQGQLEDIRRDDVVAVGTTFFRLARFLRDTAR